MSNKVKKIIDDIDFKDDLICFSEWNGPNGMCEFIIKKTGCKPFSGCGITPRISKNTTILRSVDNTYYYDDNLTDIDNIKYTLFGQNGDQDESEKRFNEKLLNPNKSKYIFLYRVKIHSNKKREWIWYGKYKIINHEI
jgi:hypothetical protein